MPIRTFQAFQAAPWGRVEVPGRHLICVTVTLPDLTSLHALWREANRLIRDLVEVFQETTRHIHFPMTNMRSRRSMRPQSRVEIEQWRDECALIQNAKYSRE